MLELNGELLKPLNELGRTTSQATPSLPGAGGAANDNKDSIRRRVELGSVKLDANVSDSNTTNFIYMSHRGKH